MTHYFTSETPRGYRQEGSSGPVPAGEHNEPTDLVLMPLRQPQLRPQPIPSPDNSKPRGKEGEALILPESARGPVTISLGRSCDGRAEAAHCPPGPGPWL